VSACVWDYADGMEFLRRFWDAASALDPAARELDEGGRFPLCQPDALTELFRTGGLRDVRCEPLEIATAFTGFDDYWRPFLGGTGPAPSFVASLEPERRAALARRLADTLQRGPDGTLALSARAWSVHQEVSRRQHCARYGAGPAVAEQQLRLIAGAEHQRLPARRVVVEDRHALARHLVASPRAVGVGETFEVRVDLACNLDLHRVDAGCRDNRIGVLQAFRARRTIGHLDAENILRPERLGGEHGADGGIDAAGEAENDALEPDLAHLVGNERRQDAPHERRVGRNQRGIAIRMVHFVRLRGAARRVATRFAAGNRRGAGFFAISFGTPCPASVSRPRMRMSSLIVRSMSSSRNSGDAMRCRRAAFKLISAARD